MNKITILHRIVSFLGAGYLHLMGRSCRTQKLDHPSFLSLRRENKRLIYALWHNTQVFLAYHHRGEKVHLMVSQSRDGEYIAQVMKRMGLNTVRGSSSSGGRKAFRDMVSLLQDGHQVGFTPDGPRGPIYSVSSGVIGAAQMTGAPIIPVAVRLSHKIVFKSWDRFMLPLPFGHVVVAHGEPIFIGPEDDHEKAKDRVKAALHRVTEEAELSLSSASTWWTSALGTILSFLYLLFGIIFLPLLTPVAFFKYGIRRTLRHLGERFGWGNISVTSKPRLWFHAASLGEWQALRPLIKRFQSSNTISLFVTCSTPEAKKLISQQESQLEVSLLPLDLFYFLPRFVRRLNPFALILIETELWPYLIHTCYKRNIPIILANGRLSRRSLLSWKFLKPLASRFLSQLSWLYVRSDQDGRNYCALHASPHRVTITGNMKSDNLKILSWEDKQKKKKELFGHPEGLYIVAGSTWFTEEESILKIFKRSIKKKIRLILAPRRPARFREVEKILETHPFTWSKWSMVKNIGEWTTDILMVDTLGDLKDLYGAGDLAFIGGSLIPKGGQNPLEPAACRIPLLFGPYMDNFGDEAEEFKRKGAARQVRHVEDLMVDLEELINDDSLRRSMGEAAANVVASKQGAVDRTFQGLCDILKLKVHE